MVDDTSFRGRHVIKEGKITNERVKESNHNKFNIIIILNR